MKLHKLHGAEAFFAWALLFLVTIAICAAITGCSDPGCFLRTYDCDASNRASMSNQRGIVTTPKGRQMTLLDADAEVILRDKLPPLVSTRPKNIWGNTYEELNGLTKQ